MTNNVDPEMTTRLKQMIVSVNGDDSPKIVNQLAETMLTKDAHEFRQHIVKVSPGIEFRVLITCPSCGEEEVRVLPMDINFFWPGAEL